MNPETRRNRSKNILCAISCLVLWTWFSLPVPPVGNRQSVEDESVALQLPILLNGWSVVNSEDNRTLTQTASGRMTVVSTGEIHCGFIGNRVMRTMYYVRKNFGDDLLVVTLVPDADPKSEEASVEYSKTFCKDCDSWLFAAGNEDTVRRFFQLIWPIVNDQETRERATTMVNRTTSAFLFDQSGHFVGAYTTLDGGIELMKAIDAELRE